VYTSLSLSRGVIFGMFALVCLVCSLLLLGGDTAVPQGLHARLCHAFLVLFAYGIWASQQISAQEKGDS